ncbi:MAG: outer membrane lipoprotein-sorting protein [Myxococcota bacterium]
MKRTLWALALLAGTAHAEEPAPPPVPTAAELLAKVDANLQSTSQSSTAKMVVNNGRRTREYVLKIVARGQTDSAVEYVAPEREKGTRMLKIDDQMWLYMPRAERVQKISGHMMRQGMMGSDMSYEDAMATADFDEMYTAKVAGSEMLEGRSHWKVEAVAKDKSVTYPKRVLWIDEVTFIPSKQELYAVSGMLLKTWTMSDVRLIDGKHVPHQMTITDQLKPGSNTTFITSDLQFDVPLQDEVFSLRWLERGQ